MRHQLGPVTFTHVTFYQPAVDELSAYVVDSNHDGQVLFGVRLSTP